MIFQLRILFGLILLARFDSVTPEGETNTTPEGETNTTPEGETETTPESEMETPHRGRSLTVPAGSKMTLSGGGKMTFPDNKEMPTYKKINPPSQKATIIRARTKDAYQPPMVRILQKVRRSYFSFLCSLLNIFPSVGRLSLKSKSLKQKMIRVGLPRSCSNLILSVEYSLRNIEELKKKLYERQIPVVWVVGGPGSGKGTLCKQMADTEGYTHISVGDSLRSEVGKNPMSTNSFVLQDMMRQGALIPNVATLNILARDMLSKIGTSKGFLIDGFPRTLETAKMFKEKIKSPDVIISLQVKDQTLMKRLLSRNEGRADDNEETIKKRLEVYHKLQHLVTSDKMFASKVKEVDGEGEKQDVFKRFSDAIHENIHSSEKANS